MIPVQAGIREVLYSKLSYRKNMKAVVSIAYINPGEQHGRDHF
jgi:hypothetical protein